MRWDLASKQYSNPFKPGKHKYMSQQWLEESIGAQAWDSAIEEMVFNQYSFDRSLARQESILEKAKDVSGLKNTPYSQFNVLFDIKSASSELDVLKTEIDAFPGEPVDKEQKRFLSDKKQRYDKLNAFTEAIQKGITNLQPGGKFTEEDYDAIRQSFDNYTQYLGKVNGEYINTQSMETTFREMIDYHLLKDRSFKANDAVNGLLDPQNFKRRFDRIKELRYQVYQNRKAEIKKSLEEYLKMIDTNDMLNDLYEAGMFFDVKDLVALKEEGKIPDVFYYVNEQSDSKLEVPADSDDYEKAIEVLKKYVPVISNIDIGKVMSDPYTQVGRSKLKNDKRTYSDYAKQFGFDVNAPETKVPLIQVLDAISKSQYATSREKELAKKLMEIADKKETVSFVNNSTQPGSYSETTQTVIDARWSSNDYKQGLEGAALEQVILKQEMHRRAAEALEKDAGFNKEMTALMNEAREAYDKLTDDEKRAMVDPSKRGFEGFANVNGFVAEAMANERFQKFLGTVTSKQDNKSQNSWKTFIQKVLRQMRKLLGTTPNGTVLNAAMDAIAAKLDSMYTSLSPIARKAEETTEEAPQVANVTNQISITDLRTKHPTLANAIMDAYIKENTDREARGNDALDENYADKTRDELFESDEFAMYLKSPMWKKKEDLIKQYNRTGATPGTAQATRPATSKEDVTDQEWNNFTDNNVVSRVRIITIAEKIKNREVLSDREQAIFQTTDPGNPEKDWGGLINKYIVDSAASIPTIKTREVKAKLRTLGYTQSEIRLMSAGEAWRISYQGLTKAERTEIELADQQAAREELAQQRQEIRERVQTEIDNAQSYGELMEIRSQLLVELQTNPLLRTAAGYTGTEIENLIQARKEQLAISINFDEIAEGDILILNDGNETPARVTSKDSTGRFITVQHLDDMTVEEYITEDEMSDKVLFKDSDALRNTPLDDVQEVNEEDQEVSNDTITTANDVITDPDIVDSVLNADDADSDNWEDDINIC